MDSYKSRYPLKRWHPTDKVLDKRTKRWREPSYLDYYPEQSENYKIYAIFKKSFTFDPEAHLASRIIITNTSPPSPYPIEAGAECQEPFVIYPKKSKRIICFKKPIKIINNSPVEAKIIITVIQE